MKRISPNTKTKTKKKTSHKTFEHSQYKSILNTLFYIYLNNHLVNSPIHQFPLPSEDVNI